MGINFFSVYIHIPFCKKKCNYCSFYSISQLSYKSAFIKSILKELNIRSKLIKSRLPSLKTIYFGGGTPSILNLKEIEELFLVFSRIKDFKTLDEVTFEANPESLNVDKIKLLKDYGISRLSIGLQSSKDCYLKFLGRICTYKDFLKKYDIAKKNFSVNVDLIYGLPQQNEKDLIDDLNQLIRLKPDHLSFYGLEIYKNTPFWGKVKTDDKKMSRFYHLIRNFLISNGYNHYEISNFALKGKESKHNMNYWNYGEYIGFGPSAASHISGRRWTNISSVESYIKALNNDKIKLEYIEKLTETDILNERLMLGLRMCCGIDLNDDVYMKFKDEIADMVIKGYMEFFNGRVRIKPDYLFVFNSIVSNLIR
ncbi:MAG: radical SAM family heme chaperone HemW [Elusimicrobiota bacterium]